MGSPFRSASVLNAANAAALATLACAALVVCLLLFITGRRIVRARYFRRHDEAARRIRRRWPEMLRSHVLPDSWRSDKLTCDVALEIALDSLERDDDSARDVVEFLRRSALLERAIYVARTARGWRRESALLRLGSTRAPEVLPTLIAALDSPSASLRTTAVRALGRTGLPQAATVLLERVAAGSLAAPAAVLKHALVAACRTDPTVLLPFLRDAHKPQYELLCHIAGEVASDKLADELMLLSGDRAPEIRAAAARAVCRVDKKIALPLLAELSMDDVWYVRLRAVMSLAQIRDPEARDALVRTLCDTTRLVRQRSAVALVEYETDLPGIAAATVATGDKYAAQALVSHLERCGKLEGVLDACSRDGCSDVREALGRACDALRQAPQRAFAAAAAVR
jgi:HEAT repeat protein